MGQRDKEQSDFIKSEDAERAEKLLSLLIQGGAEIKIENGQLLVRPVGLAKKLASRIRELKPEILIAHWRCPVCLAELKLEVLPAGRKIWCECGKYEHWQALRWKKLKGLNEA